MKFTHPAGCALLLWVPLELHVKMGSSLSHSLTRFSLTEIIIHLNTWLLKSILIFIYRRRYDYYLELIIVATVLRFRIGVLDALAPKRQTS